MDFFTIDTIAATLEGLEETIIFKLIDRAQFKANHRAYQDNESGFVGAEGHKSLFELRLLYHERMDALFGRFSVPEERPFCSGLQTPRRVVTLPDTGLHISDYNTVNITAHIKNMYLSHIPLLCIDGDDGQYGSSVEHDVYALQALSRRIHFGAFYVAESKFRSDPTVYRTLIDNADSEALINRLTRPDVEKDILRRVEAKLIHTQAKINTTVRRKIDPAIILTIYQEHIIPLTKQGEVMYLLQRKP